MAGKGPAPKAMKRRRNAEPPNTKVSADGGLRGPDLPDGYNWHPQTLLWWQTWRRSPQAQRFTDTDWSFLLDTALMHSAMWAKSQWTLAAEVRLRAAKFGATPEDRARLRLEVDVPVAESEKPTTAAAARKAAAKDPRTRLSLVDGGKVAS